MIWTKVRPVVPGLYWAVHDDFIVSLYRFSCYRAAGPFGVRDNDKVYDVLHDSYIRAFALQEFAEFELPRPPKWVEIDEIGKKELNGRVIEV